MNVKTFSEYARAVAVGVGVLIGARILIKSVPALRRLAD